VSSNNNSSGSSNSNSGVDISQARAAGRSNTAPPTANTNNNNNARHVNPIQALLNSMVGGLINGGANNGGARIFAFGAPGGVMFAPDLSQLMNGIGLAGNPVCYCLIFVALLFTHFVKGDYAWGNQFDQILHNLFQQSGNKGLRGSSYV
jgi:hypothetical protein